MPQININTEKCKGCALCVIACPKNIVGLEKDKLNTKGYHPAYITQPEKCIGCAFCAITCPDCCIKVEK